MEFAKEILQLPMCVEKSRPDSAFGDAHDLRDLGMRHPLDIEHRDHSAMIWRQFLEGFVQALLEFAKVRFTDRRARGRELDELLVVLDARIHVVQTHVMTPATLLQEVDGHVYTDRVDPSVKARLTTESVDRAVRLRPDILEKVVRVLVVRGHVVHETVQAGAVLDDQLVKRRRIARLSAGDQLSILLTAGVFGHGTRFGNRPRIRWGSGFGCGNGGTGPRKERAGNAGRDALGKSTHLRALGIDRRTLTGIRAAACAFIAIRALTLPAMAIIISERVVMNW